MLTTAFKTLIPLSPYLAFLLLFSWLSMPTHSWGAYSSLLFSAVLLLAPVVYLKIKSLRVSGLKAASWWLLGFILVPFIHLLLHENLPGYESVVKLELDFFLWLFATEALVLVKSQLKPVNLTALKRHMTMDNILLSIVVFFSVLWALVFNSIDNPMENQPINVLIDLKRNLLRFDEFLGYFLQFFAIYFCGYILYWVNHHVLVNRVMANFGVFHYVWAACAFTLVAVPLMSQLALWLPINAVEFTLLPSGNQDPFDAWNLRIAMIIMVISLPLILAFKWQQQSTELAQLKQKNTQTELKWLQQQINPHFLFNTLNNLYALTLAKAEQAPQSILQLANLLRFVVYKGGQQRVTLQEEVAYLKDYIALQQMRVSHKARIEFTVKPELEDHQQLQVAPLLFVVLLENAFKHGIDASDRASWLTIDLSLADGQLQLVCKNSVDERAGPADYIDGGVGISNLQRRLTLLYPGQHSLSTEKSPDEFTATLTLKADESN